MSYIRKPLIHEDPPYLPGETYLPIPGHLWYLVSDFGNVFSLARETSHGSIKRTATLSARALIPRLNGRGYLDVALCPGRGIRVDRKVHQLVLETFIGFRRANRVADHSNGIRTDNRLSNLRYVSLEFNFLNRKKGSVYLNPRNNTWYWKIQFRGKRSAFSDYGFSTEAEALASHDICRRELLTRLLAESTAEDLAADIAEGRVHV